MVAERVISPRFRITAMAAAIVALLAIAWLVTPLRNYANLPGLISMAEAIGEAPFAPVLMIVGYVIGGFLMVPLTLLQIATGLVFGSWPGLLYAMAGTIASAMTMYWAGQLMGPAWLRRWLGPRVDALSHKVARKGVPAMLAIRQVPVAPFAIVNFVAGATHISQRDYLLGTTFGVIPGLVLKVVFTDQIADAAQMSDFSLVRRLIYVAVAVLVVGIGVRWYTGRRLRKDA